MTIRLIPRHTAGLLKSLCPALLASLLTAWALPSLAETYPAKPVNLVVPFAAGSDADRAARLLSQAAQKQLGQPLVITNRPGASGSIGSKTVRDAAPDGHTLLLARVGSQAVLPALTPSTPYKWNDFTFIGLLELNPFGCFVRTDSPYHSLADLLDAVRRQPGKLNYASSGTGTILSLGPKLLLNHLKLPVDAAVEIPYNGSNEVTSALLGGQVDFACSNTPILTPQVQAGKLRGLLVTHPERLKELPNVPSARELGFPELEVVVGWSALYGPPNLDKAVLARWQTILQTLSRDPEWVSGNERVGSIPAIKSSDETSRFVQQQFTTYERLGRIVNGESR